MRQDLATDLRTVPARELSIGDFALTLAPAGEAGFRREFEFMRRATEAQLQAIPVIAAADGTLRPVADQMRVALYQRFASDALVRCRVVDAGDGTGARQPGSWS